MSWLERWAQEQAAKFAQAHPRVADTARRLREGVEDVHMKGVRAAAHISWHPAEVLLYTYDMPRQLQLPTMRDFQVLHALTAAEFGRQVSEPLLLYFAQNATSQQALPEPSIQPNPDAGTNVVPYQGEPTRSPYIDLGINVVAGLGIHFIRQASKQFEQVEALVLEDVDFPEGEDGERERQRLVAQIPRLRQVAKRFVGQVAGDAQGVLSATDQAALGRIIGSHATGIADIVAEYHRSQPH